MIEYKTIIKIIIMYSIGNTPLREQDLTAYPLLAHLITKSIITALDRFCNTYLPRLCVYALISRSATGNVPHDFKDCI